MPKLISPNQVAFVLGRQIQDNIVVAQKVLHKFKAMRGKKRCISWNIDLAKAYDKLQWNFIRSVIVKTGMGSALIELIMWYITSVNYRVVLNGELTELFIPGCGIRQGGPFPHYIFI